MRNLERFQQSSILSKNPSALFPPKKCILQVTASSLEGFVGVILELGKGI